MAGQPIPNTGNLEFPIRVVPPKPKGSGRAWYRPNHRSFGAFMKSEQMRDVTAEVAEDIGQLAAATQPAPSETDPERTGSTYTVQRESGLVKVAGNLRVRVDINGDGPGVERAEFGGSRWTRFRTLAAAASKFGDWHHGEDVR